MATGLVFLIFVFFALVTGVVMLATMVMLAMLLINGFDGDADDHTANRGSNRLSGP
jgi:hypothetical protein